MSLSCSSTAGGSGFSVAGSISLARSYSRPMWIFSASAVHWNRRASTSKPSFLATFENASYLVVAPVSPAMAVIRFS